MRDLAAPPVQLDWGDVYITHRYAEAGVLTYRLPVPPGNNYSVGLMFVEQYDGAAMPGGRLMDLYINGDPLDKNIDVWSLAGEKLFAPYFLQKHGIASVGNYIEVSLVPITENPMLSGLVIEGENAASILWRTVDGKTPTPNAPDAPADTTVFAAAEEAPAQGPDDDIPVIGSGTWRNLEYSSGQPIVRHEACAMFAKGLLYNIGGRGIKDISVFNPLTGTWTTRPGPGVEINHIQCVYYNDRIYLGGGWYGAYPFEKEHADLYAYDIPSNTWVTLTGLPAGRRRGGGAFVEYDGQLYLSHGAIGGHGTHAVTTGFLDMYDPLTDSWTELASAPNPRDHTGGGVINGKLCVAGGRDGSAFDFWNANIGPIDCYDFATGSWSERASLQEPRGGAMVGTTCEGYLMIAGGEGKTARSPGGQAFDRVDLYDESTDTFLEPTYMTSPRHGSGLAMTSCECGNVHVPSGSAGLGGGPEVSTTDVWNVDGVTRVCV